MEHIVVGVDGSDGAVLALRWAVQEGRLHGASVTAVMAWSHLDQRHTTRGEDFDPDYGEADAVAALDAYVVGGIGADVAADVERSAVCDIAVRALLDASAAASLLVVGTRGLGGFRGMLLGSVSQHCLRHATCPVAIVRDHDDQRLRPRTRERIVVGIDGSETSRRALRWAVEEGRVRRAAVEVVHAWNMPYIGGHPFTAAAFDPTVLHAAAHRVLDSTVDEEDTSGLPQPPERILVNGSAAPAILETAKGADLVVVGSRGLGGFSGLLLG